MLKKILFFSVIAFAMQSCYYDKEEFLAIKTNGCDTTNVTFADDIMPIIQNNCIGCHGTSGGVSLESYADVFNSVKDSTFIWSVQGSHGITQMPKDGSPLSTCNMRQIEIWINNGAKND